MLEWNPWVLKLTNDWNKQVEIFQSWEWMSFLWIGVEADVPCCGVALILSLYACSFMPFISHIKYMGTYMNLFLYAWLLLMHVTSLRKEGSFNLVSAFLGVH